ncbi:FAD-binding oxidoreductase/lyase [Paraburkholderia diazotrophica]|uniref:FAD dependent oxidoreductase n=1 Tax=Paraburkholderia diazotrophica TaxID=667676 RepID=A0A1H7EL71_9BURK|nr:hypothetical protein [Paraburkholderia diazotrophica]SEK11445.1 hypothetical protein SAMN05192539_105210 [Paraburkholderia diazotrophica]
MKLVNGEEAQRIAPESSGFAVQGKRGTYRAARVVLAAGLGNRALAPHVGLHATVTPNRGQVLISKRVAPFLHYPTLNGHSTPCWALLPAAQNDGQTQFTYEKGPTSVCPQSRELKRISA